MLYYDDHPHQRGQTITIKLTVIMAKIEVIMITNKLHLKRSLWFLCELITRMYTKELRWLNAEAIEKRFYWWHSVPIKCKVAWCITLYSLWCQLWKSSPHIRLRWVMKFVQEQTAKFTYRPSVMIYALCLDIIVPRRERIT